MGLGGNLVSLLLLFTLALFHFFQLSPAASGQFLKAFTSEMIIQTSTILHTALEQSNDFHGAQEPHLLALSALSVVLKKALLVLQELIKETVLLVMVIAQVDRCVALDSLMRHSLQQESMADGWDGEGKQVARQRAERYRQLLSQDTGKIKSLSVPKGSCRTRPSGQDWARGRDCAP